MPQEYVMTVRQNTLSKQAKANAFDLLRMLKSKMCRKRDSTLLVTERDTETSHVGNTFKTQQLSVASRIHQLRNL
jgi:hypothetical protein